MQQVVRERHATNRSEAIEEALQGVDRGEPHDQPDVPERHQDTADVIGDAAKAHRIELVEAVGIEVGGTEYRERQAA